MNDTETRYPSAHSGARLTFSASLFVPGVGQGPEVDDLVEVWREFAADTPILAGVLGGRSGLAEEGAEEKEGAA